MKILFVHPFGIGDVIFSLAAAEALAKRGHTIDFLCNERTEEFLKLCPVVRKTHRFDRTGLRRELKLGRFLQAAGRYNDLRRALAAERYDAVLDFSMGREYALVAWCAGIRRRIGWDYKGRGRWLNRRVPVTGFDDRSPREYAMDLARIADPLAGDGLAYPAIRLGAEKMPPEEKKWIADNVGAGPWIVLAPGGGESWGRDAHYKQWPPDAWAHLAQILIRDTRAKIVVIGSSSEETLVRAVATQAVTVHAPTVSRTDGPAAPESEVVAVVGEPLHRVLALLAGARAFVGTDGGLLHLANLVGTPAVGLYGPVSERGYAPLDTAGPFRIVTADVPCRPCYRQFHFTGCDFEKRCLTTISADRVAGEVRALLGQ